MTRYRIVEINYRAAYYFRIEKKGWVFWRALQDCDGEITFYNLELAETHLERLLTVPKRKIIKEVDTEKKL